MKLTLCSLTIFLAAALFLPGCRRDNGLPSDLTEHLSDRGTRIAPSRVHAPLSSRAGYIVARHDTQLSANIISTFKLEKIRPEDRLWKFAIERAGVTVPPKELWGIAGRPTQFKLKNGGQFEYFYLIITEDGLMYLLAEYAYG
jgi:hypothetical protein